MGIFHIVLFEFKAAIDSATVQDACRRMLALKTQCVHPTTKQPYIKLFAGGKDNSPEGVQKGITHGFIVEFENEEDRKYYLDKDPAHDKFKKHVGGLLETAQVVDFTPDVFK